MTDSPKPDSSTIITDDKASNAPATTVPIAVVEPKKAEVQGAEHKPATPPSPVKK